MAQVLFLYDIELKYFRSLNKTISINAYKGKSHVTYGVPHVKTVCVGVDEIKFGCVYRVNVKFK